MTNVLLTGGAGYIGSATAYYLKKAGFTPVVLDSLVHGHAFAAKYGPFIEGDIANEALVEQICRDYEPAALLHFAAFIEVGESVQNPQKYWENNHTKAKKLFSAASAGGIKRVVFSSTAAVYGTPAHDAPITETHPLKPINPYGETKLAAEESLRALEVEGVHSMALRYFNAAGALPSSEEIGEAHSPETHLIPNVILAGLGQKEEIRLFGTDYPTPDGTAIRDYIHVLDLAAAHAAALRYLLEGGATDACNLGTGQGTSVRAIIETVEKALGHSVPKTEHPRRAGDPPRLVADATRAQEKLNWKPQESLQSIVESALSWHLSSRYREAVQSR